jgi:hypothetical protein
MYDLDRVMVALEGALLSGTMLDPPRIKTTASCMSAPVLSTALHTSCLVHRSNKPGARRVPSLGGNHADTGITVIVRIPWAPWIRMPSMSAVADGPVMNTA